MLGLIQLAMCPSRLDELLNVHGLSGPPVRETKGTCWQMFGPTTWERNIESIPKNFVESNTSYLWCLVSGCGKLVSPGVHVVAERCQVGAAFAYMHHVLWLLVHAVATETGYMPALLEIENNVY